MHSKCKDNNIVTQQLLSQQYIKIKQQKIKMFQIQPLEYPW